jgi:hypothetical protein
MTALLEECIARVDPARLTFFVNDRRAALAEEAFRNARSPRDRQDKRFILGDELVNAGRNIEAVQAYEALEEEVKAVDPARWRRAGRVVLLHKAMAYLRIAED